MFVQLTKASEEAWISRWDHDGIMRDSIDDSIVDWEDLQSSVVAEDLFSQVWAMPTACCTAGAPWSAFVQARLSTETLVICIVILILGWMNCGMLRLGERHRGQVKLRSRQRWKALETSNNFQQMFWDLPGHRSGVVNACQCSVVC